MSVSVAATLDNLTPSPSKFNVGDGIRAMCVLIEEGKEDIRTSVYRKRKHEGIGNGSIEITRSVPRGGVLYIMITRNTYCAYADITRAVRTG